MTACGVGMTVPVLSAADIDPKSAGRIVFAIYQARNQLVPLSPDERYIVLRALCSAFLKEDDEAMLRVGEENS